MRSLVPALLLALPATAAAQPLCLADEVRQPFVDGEVIACGPPTLTVVREAAVYDPALAEWRQAVLLRFANPSDDELIVSGVIDLFGVELIGEPSYLAGDLRRGDFEWAVAPLSHYEDPGDCSALLDPPPPHPERGLEFGDLMRYGPDRVRFEFAAAGDLDDVRFIVSAPDPAPASGLRITLYEVLTTRGVAIQVGSADVDLTPDDGVYAGLRVTARLRELGLEIMEDCVSGDAADGLRFDLRVPTDAPAPPRGYRDRWADANGALEPITAVGAPVALRWRPSELVSPAGDALAIGGLAGLDLGLCVDGENALPLEAFVEAADGAPDGIYGGQIEVWEDADGDRHRDTSEAGDFVRVAVVVGPPPAGDPCELLPPLPDAGIVPGDEDGGFAPDGGADAGLDAALDLDAGLDGGGLDADPDVGEDAGGDAASDAASDADGSVDAEADAVRVDGMLFPIPDAGLDDGDLGAEPGDGALAPDGDVARPDLGPDGEPSDAIPGDGDTLDGGDGDGEADGALDAGPGDAEPGDAGRADGGMVADGGADAGVDAADAADGAPDGPLEDSGDRGPRDSQPAPPDSEFDPPDSQPDPPDAGDMRSDGGTRPADPGDPQGGALSCRSVPGGPGGSPALLLLALTLLAARRRALALAALACVARPADAQVDVRRFAPSPALSPYLDLDGAATLGAGQLGARILTAIERRPLVFARDGERTVDIISTRLTLDVALAVGVTDWLDVGAALPLVLAQDGRSIASDAALAGFAVVDPALTAKLRLVQPSEGVGIALRVAGTAPLGDADALAGESGPTGTAMVALEFPVTSRFDIALDLGYRLREATRLGDIALDDELLFGLGASWRVTPGFALAAEFTGAAAAADPFAVPQQTPGEVDVLGRVQLADALSAVVGGGAGLLPGYGSPSFRAFAGLQFAPRNHDFDGDGLADRRDLCLEEPGPASERGCPVPERVAAAIEAPEPVSRDQDADGLLDELDQCPYLPEDRDGFRDDDGCPDADNDLDLLADAFDADPLGPEDWDGFEDRDGIPDLDNDHDGLADFRDPCPDEAGGSDGCPASLAPTAPAGEPGGLAAGEGPDAPLVLGRTLHPARPIAFAFARPELTAEALPLIDGLAGYLLDHPELDRVEVGVHVDALGSRRWKHWLSRARAESVVAALVERGVPDERVFPRGYGPEVPVDSNRTKAGRANNRRVELRALRPFEVPQPTRAGREGRAPRVPRKGPALPEPRARWLGPDTLVLRPTAPIRFERDRPGLSARAAPRIAELAQRLKANPGWSRIEVGVHTDGLGDTRRKLRLSRARAEAIVEALVAEGVERSRLTARGYGATRRLRGDGTADDRAVNRRVELRVLEPSLSLAPGSGR